MDEYMTLKDVADLLKISVRNVYRLIDAGELPRPIKLGRAVRMRASELSAYLDRLAVPDGRQAS